MDSISDPLFETPVGFTFRKPPLAWDSSNHIVAAGFASDSLAAIDFGTRTPHGNIFAPDDGTLDGPAGIAYRDSLTRDSEGYLLSDGEAIVCNQRADEVVIYDFVSPFHAPHNVDVFSGCGLDGPADVLSDANRNLLVSSFHTDEIIRFDSAGVCSVLVSAGAHGLDGPEGLAWTGAGRFAVVSKNTGRILEFNANTGVFVREIASGLTRPTYMTVGAIQAPDCNGNDIPDSWDVLDGYSSDINADLVPDECQGLLVGDMNCDGVVSVSDIGGFVLALTDPAGYAAQFPACNIDNADTNGDGSISVSDIGPMVAILVGG